VNGARHQTSLALAGMLLRAGWNETATRKFLRAVASTANDEETPSRLHDVCEHGHENVDVLRFHCAACGRKFSWKTPRILGKTGGSHAFNFPCSCGEDTLGIFLDPKGRWHADCA